MYFPDFFSSLFFLHIPLKVIPIYSTYIMSRFRMCDYIARTDKIIGFIDHLYTPRVAARNYRATANFHTLHFTGTRQVVWIFTSRILATDL
jgi:hypothetical protein